MNDYYHLLTAIIACSKLEQAIMLLRNSELFSFYSANISERIEGDTTLFDENSTFQFIESKYFSIQYTLISNENLEEVHQILTSILQVLDDKKDASSETLQKKRSKQELDIFTIFAHEFRTPLTVIQSSVELLLDFFPEWDTQKNTDFLQSIQQQTTSISKLLEMIAELYDARSNTQEVVVVYNQTIEDFFEQINSILSKRFHFQLKIESNKEVDFTVKIPIRALMYVMSIALQSFNSQTHSCQISVRTSQSEGILIEILSSHSSFSDNEIKLLGALFNENVIEDVSGEWLPYLLASICAQYINATISISNTSENSASFKLFL